MKRVLKSLAKSLGLDITRRTMVNDRYDMLIRLCRKYGCKQILDVGANEGQFARLLLDRSWEGTILSFEPLGPAHAELAAQAARYSRWHVLPQMALGAQTGYVELNVSMNSQSSSFLPILKRHLMGAPDSAYTHTEKVPMLTLSSVLEDLGENNTSALKMDVQGYESEVFKGASRVLNNLPIIFTEMSLQTLYAGESLFTELSSQILSSGYTCVGIWPGYFDPNEGEMLQVDALFASKRGAENSGRREIPADLALAG